jgi:hypothetical protein
MHGMGEAEDHVKGRGRWDWDIQSCVNLFKALKINLKADSIKFCRRVGQPGDRARPLVVGFYDERDKTQLLRCDTRGTAFEDVEVYPDLTKMQRREEASLKEEEVRRNMDISVKDR